MSHVFLRRSCTQLSSTAVRWSSPVGGPCSRRLQQPSFKGVNSRAFRTTSRLRKDLEDESIKETNQRDLDAHEEEVKAGLEAATRQQIKRPWQREGADKPPVDQEAKDMNKTMTKGRRASLLMKCRRILEIADIAFVYQESFLQRRHDY